MVSLQRYLGCVETVWVLTSPQDPRAWRKRLTEVKNSHTDINNGQENQVIPFSPL